LCVCLGLAFCVLFCFSVDHFVVLDLVSNQEKERIRYYLFRRKTLINQSVHQFSIWRVINRIVKRFSACEATQAIVDGIRTRRTACLSVGFDRGCSRLVCK